MQEQVDKRAAPFPCDRRFWAATLALACMHATTFIMNIVVFPAFDAMFTYARDLSVLASVLGLLILGLRAAYRPAALRAQRTQNLALAALLASAVCLPPALAFHCAPLLVVAACGHALVRAWMNVCCAICALELTSSQMSCSILLSYIVAPFVALAAWLMPAATGLVLFSVLPAVAVRLTWGVAGPFLAEAEGHEAPADFSATQPSTFLSFGSQVFGVFFLMRVAFGYALRIDTAPFADAAFLIPAVGMYAWVTRHAGRPFPADLLTRASVLFVVAGYYLAGVTGESLRAVSIPLFYMGSALFDIVVWAVLLAAGQRNRSAAVATFSWGYAVRSAGSVTGAALGAWVAAAHVPHVDVAVSGLLLMVVLGYVFLRLRASSFAEAIAGIEPLQPLGEAQVPAASPGPTFEERCEALAVECGLPPREREVFEMLARGRNREFIQERLVVSRNTVKAHVKHVYAKLGIHSHQELIDRVENYDRRA